MSKNNPGRWDKTHAVTHYVGIGLLMDLVFLFVLILTAEVSDNEITPAVVALISGPQSLATLLIGVISGIAIGKNLAKKDADVVPIRPEPDEEVAA